MSIPYHVDTLNGGLNAWGRFRAWVRCHFPLLWITVVFFMFGTALITRSDRWVHTPAYGILFEILPPQAWGVIYLAIGVVMVAALRWDNNRFIVITAHTLAVAFTAAWLGAFILRVLTDRYTTVVNVVSWSTYLVFLLQSMVAIDRVDEPRS